MQSCLSVRPPGAAVSLRPGAASSIRRRRYRAVDSFSQTLMRHTKRATEEALLILKPSISLPLVLQPSSSLVLVLVLQPSSSLVLVTGPSAQQQPGPGPHPATQHQPAPRPSAQQQPGPGPHPAAQQQPDRRPASKDLPLPEDQQPSTPEDDSPSQSVIMEADELELTKDELRTWIKQMVKQDKLIESDVLQKCTLIQAMVDRKIQRASELVKLCESVEACEAVVRKQYALLGWDYRDTDSEDDDTTSCETSTLESSATVAKSKKPSIRKKLVVVLTRLSENQIKMFCPPTPLDDHSEIESSDNSDCDKLWDPKQRSDDSDSDSSISSNKPALKRRRKGDHKNQKRFQGQIKSQHGRITATTSNDVKISTPQASANTDAKSPVMNTPTRPAKAEGASLEQKVTVPCQKSDTVTETAPSAPLGAIKVTMSVLARRKAMSWRRGIIVEMMEREDGRMKYKIQFESKGKSLVSGHHIAFDYMPKVDSLLVGTRVVVKHQTEEGQFCPGTLAELPSRKNRMRFLVFMDDHTPLYVNLPSLHLVCRPLTDPLDDIADVSHKSFMQRYLKAWPYPPQTQYRVGQVINAELDGVIQRCTVLTIDSSLFKVLVSTDQHEEWIYRGSSCLEHIIKMNSESSKAAP